MHQYFQQQEGRKELKILASTGLCERDRDIKYFQSTFSPIKTGCCFFWKICPNNTSIPKIWQVPFQVLAIPRPLYQRPKSSHYVLAWVKFLIPNYVIMYISSQFIRVGLDPQTVSDGLPIKKIQHSIFNNLYATFVFFISINTWSPMLLFFDC